MVADISGTQVIGLIAAIAAAVLFGIAAVVQAHGVRVDGSAIDTLTEFVRHALGNRLILFVVAAYLAGFILHAISIWYLPLYLAQATVALSLPVTALTARRLRERMGSTEWIAILGIVAGLALVVSGSAEAGDSESMWPLAVVLWAVLIVGVLALMLGAKNADAGVLGAIAGLGYAGSAIAVRGVTTPLDLAVVASAVAVPAFGLLAFWVYSMALSRASVVSSSAPLVVGQTLIPALVGILALEDQVRTGWSLAVLFGMTLAVSGAIVLGRATALPNPDTPTAP